MVQAPLWRELPAFSLLFEDSTLQSSVGRNENEGARLQARAKPGGFQSKGCWSPLCDR